MSLEIKNLRVSVKDKPIVQGVSLSVAKGTVSAIMGPNGSGKSTLANALLGHPKYTVTSGQIVVDGQDVIALSPDKRARAGLFLSAQYPPEIPGVTVANFLRLAAANRGAGTDILTFQKKLRDQMTALHIDPSFAARYINTGFSGGEKKRAEILQLLMLNPGYAILDEIDSGLDVDALKTVAEGINRYRPGNGILLITHYNRILEYVVPDIVHIMAEGKIVKSGGKELAREIEQTGYSKFLD